jgi:hypothetical protein
MTCLAINPCSLKDRQFPIVIEESYSKLYAFELIYILLHQFVAEIFSGISIRNKRHSRVFCVHCYEIVLLQKRSNVRHLMEEVIFKYIDYLKFLLHF